ncbi:MAG: endolytic transglycosylase MltG [Lachnospiraceae bacterium]|nr:endolytic transglycosylase MltG [Lachnospiraceae bacterium]
MKNSKRYKRTVSGLSGILQVLLLVLAVVILLWLAQAAYRFGKNVFNERPMEEKPGTTVTVMIPEDASAGQIGKILKVNGLIKDVRVFVVQEKMSAYHKKEKAGEYELNTAMTPTEMLARMSPAEEDDES